MKILQIAPLWETVPPPAYGGTEAVVSVLCEELVRRGHEVVLLQRRLHLQRAYLLRLPVASGPDNLRDKRYDLMHAALSLKAGGSSTSSITTRRNGRHVALVDTRCCRRCCLITADSKFVWDQYEGWYNTISYSEKRLMPPVANRNFAGRLQRHRR
jgi:glycosyltransferase involved in cell wall biosynthesis